MLHRPLYRRKAGYSFIRSLNPAAWFRADTGVTVTGLGASTWADQSGNGRDLLQTTDASRPPYLSYSGTKYLYLPGVSGNYASTPNAAENQITGDISLRAKIRAADYTPSGIQAVIGKRIDAGSLQCFSFYIATNGTLHLVWWASGVSADKASTSATGATDGEDLWVRADLDVDDGAGNNVVRFYTGGSGDSPAWVQLGNAVTTAGTTSIDNKNTPLTLGSNQGGTAELLSGRIYSAQVYSGSSLVVDFNPSDTSDSATSFASSTTGETWTINSSGGLKAQIVGRPSLLFDGSADYLKCNAFTLNQPETVYIAFKQVSWTNNDVLVDGNTTGTMYVFQAGSTPSLSWYAGTLPGQTVSLALNTVGVVAAVYNGASSVMQLNLSTPVTGNVGAGNAGGLCIGTVGGATTGWANFQAYEILVFSTAHDATQRARVIQYLAGRAGISL